MSFYNSLNFLRIARRVLMVSLQRSVCLKEIPRRNMIIFSLFKTLLAAYFKYFAFVAFGVASITQDALLYYKPHGISFSLTRGSVQKDDSHSVIPCYLSKSLSLRDASIFLSQRNPRAEPRCDEAQLKILICDAIFVCWNNRDDLHFVKCWWEKCQVELTNKTSNVLQQNKLADKISPKRINQ